MQTEEKDRGKLSRAKQARSESREHDKGIEKQANGHAEVQSNAAPRQET